MNVNKVTATVKFSQDTGKGAWKSLEIGAEASVDPREDWQKATATLYGQLSREFKLLWSANGVTTHQEGPQIDVQPSSAESHAAVPAEAAGGTTDHFCQEHNQAFKAKEGKYGTFFSHKAPDGSWCNEPRG